MNNRLRIAGVLEMALGLVLSLGIVWAVTRVPYLPSNDGPQHSFVAYVRNHLDEPRWAERYVANNPRTSNGYVQVVRLLEPHVGLDAAHQMFIIGMLLSWSWAWFVFLRRMIGAGSFIPLVAFGAAFQWTLWIGLYPFFLASALTPVVLALVLATPSMRGRSSLSSFMLAALLLVVQAWLHSFAAVLTGGLWVALRVAQGTTLRELVQIAVAGLPSALYVLDFSRSAPMLAAPGETYWDFSYNLYETLLEFFLPGPFLQGGLFLCLAGLAVLGRPNRPIFAVGLMLVAAGTLLPAAWSGWELVRPRLVAPGYLLMCAGYFAAPALARRGAAVLVGIFVVVRIFWAGGFHRHLHEELAPLRDGVAGLELDGRTWVYLQTQGPPYSPIFAVQAGSTAFHLAQQLAPSIGGEPYYSHTADPSLHHIIRKTPEHVRWLGPIPRPTDLHAAWWDTPVRQRELRISTTLANVTFVDDVVLHGLPGDGDVMAELGYKVRLLRRDEENGSSTFVGTFGDGCSLRVRVEGPPRDAVLSIGFGTSLAPRDVMIVRGGNTVQIDGLPCGPNWITADVGCVEDRPPADVVPVMPSDGAIEVRCTLRDEVIERASTL
jgi:hypothetical protein